MINLTALHNTIGKYKFYFVAGAIIVALASLIVIQQYYAKNQPVDIEPAAAALPLLPYPEFIPNDLQPRVNSITTNIPGAFQPTEANGKVYQLEESGNTENRIEQRASGLGFSTGPKKEQQFLVWSENAKHLTYNIESGRLSYSSPPSQTTESISSFEAELKARAIIEKLKLLPTDTKSKITLLKIEADHYESTNDPELVEAFEINFFETLDGLFVYGQSTHTGTANVIVSKNGDLLKLGTRISTINYKNPMLYPIKNIQEARVDVSTTGTVVETEIPSIDPAIAAVITIESIDLKSVELAYFRNISQMYIIPIYVFTGELTTVTGRKGTAIMYTPAIKNEYIKQP